MPERDTAEAQLERILHLIGAASKEGGASLDELERALDVDRAQLLDDIDALTTRAFYHPAGSPDVLNVYLEEDRISIWTGSGVFTRPTRFTPREALCLSLGLRVLAAERGEGEREDLLALAGRFEEGLATLSRSAAAVEELLATHALDEEEPDVVRGTVLEATRARRRCRIRYWKPAATAPEERVIEPYVVVRAEGRWYALARCVDVDEVRIFRLDRIMAAALAHETFTPPDNFEPRDYVSDGRIYRAEREQEALVRYAPGIAGWLRERGLGDLLEDGAVVVRHRVADPTWITQHVLQYGGAAELLEPPDARARVREAAEGVAAGAVCDAEAEGPEA